MPSIRFLRCSLWWSLHLFFKMIGISGLDPANLRALANIQLPFAHGQCFSLFAQRSCGQGFFFDVSRLLLARMTSPLKA